MDPAHHFQLRLKYSQKHNSPQTTSTLFSIPILSFNSKFYLFATRMSRASSNKHALLQLDTNATLPCSSKYLSVASYHPTFSQQSNLLNGKQLEQSTSLSTEYSNPQPSQSMIFCLPNPTYCSSTRQKGRVLSFL